MSGTTYEAIIQTDTGETIQTLTRLYSLSYTLATNDFGAVRIELPYDEVDFELLGARDNRLLVYRTANGVKNLEGGTVSFVRVADDILSDTGLRVVRLTGVFASELLLRRIVLYKTGTDEATATTEAVDDLMKRIVDENMGPSAPTDREIDSTYFDIQGDTTSGSTISKAFSYREVLGLLKSLHDWSRENTPAIYFDIVLNSSDKLEFRTYSGQRGTDRTVATGTNPVVFSPSRGNLRNVTLTNDYSDEMTSVTALGQGRGDERNIQTRTDTARAAASVFNWRERSYQANMIQNGANADARLQAEADEQLQAYRPRIILDGDIVNTSSTPYGVAWQHGDLVTAEYAGIQYNCEIPIVQVAVSGKAETVTAKLRSTS